jgi:hypothetical protein
MGDKNELWQIGFVVDDDQSMRVAMTIYSSR